MNNTYVVIMAGGVGSRFWPGSRENKPKQFLDMMGTGKSLLRQTFERFLPLCSPHQIYVLTNTAYRDLVLEQIPELDAHQVLCEPSRNNTAPCIAYAALKLAAINPHANMVIAASDHIILKEHLFLDKVRTALEFVAAHPAMVTLGIQPTRPDTGYGYIQYKSEDQNGLHEVIRFAEKPNLETAREFVESGEYLWNSGMFFWNVQTILQAFQNLAPDIYAILEQGNAAYNTDNEDAFLAEYYPTTRNISVDFAIMEQAKNVYTIPADIGWSDLGTWASLHAECEKDHHSNAIQVRNALVTESSNNLIRCSNPDKLVVIRGLENFIVVDEADVLMIYPKNKEQEIKQTGADVKSEFGDRYL